MISRKEIEAYARLVRGTATPSEADALLGGLTPSEILCIGIRVGSRITFDSLAPHVNDMTAVENDLIAKMPTEH